MIFTTRTGVLAIFSHLDKAVAAVRAVQATAQFRFRVHSPVPRHEILDAIHTRPSPVRWYTLTGALLGFASAWALTIWTGVRMHDFGNLMVAGKPVVSLPPYVVIAFELTVLLGVIFTLIGFLIHSGLPRIFIDRGYDPSFSDDKFGLYVYCKSEEMESVKNILQKVGPDEIRYVEKQDRKNRK